MLTAVGRIHQLFPVLEAVHPATLAGLLAVILYAKDRHEERRLRYLRDRTTTYLLALLIWIVLCVPGALVPGRSFDLVFDNFIKTVLMYFVVAGSVRSVRDIERLSMIYLISATLYAAVVISRFSLGSGDAWRLGRLFYYDANDFATFAVTAMPFGLYFVHAGRSFLSRAFAPVALGILTLAFVRTGSRGGFVALIAVAIYVVWRYVGIAFRFRVAAAALVTFIVLMTASDQYWKQMGTILSDADYNRTDESGRMQVWSRGVGYMLGHPVFGVGPNNFPSAEGMLSPFAARQQFGIGVRWNAAHNSFIQVGAESGIPGLILFVAMLGATFGALRRVSRHELALAASDGATPPVAPALTASLVGFVVGSVFLSLAYSEMLYTLIALAIGLHKVTVGQFREQVRCVE